MYRDGSRRVRESLVWVDLLASSGTFEQFRCRFPVSAFPSAANVDDGVYLTVPTTYL